MADDAGENAAVAAPCPQSCNRQHDGVVSAKPERRQSRKREETADDHGFGPDPIRQGSEQRLQQEFGDVLQRQDVHHPCGGVGTVAASSSPAEGWYASGVS